MPSSYVRLQPHKIRASSALRMQAAVKQMLKPFKPAEPRFAGLDVEKDEQTGCIILKDASAYVACTVKDRMDAGDHYIVYATVGGGKVLSDGVTSVHHRKSGSNY